jgi:hypothetical protein
METSVAMTRRHVDRDPANTHTVLLMVAMAPVVSAATRLDLSPGTSSHGRLASTMPSSTRQRPLEMGSATRGSTCESESTMPWTS